MTRSKVHDGEKSDNRDGRLVVKCLRRNNDLTKEGVILTSERLDQPICLYSIAPGWDGGSNRRSSNAKLKSDRTELF